MHRLRGTGHLLRDGRRCTTGCDEKKEDTLRISNKGIATSNKGITISSKLLVTEGVSTRSKDAASISWPCY